MVTTVTVLHERLPEATKALDKLIKKCNRYNNDPITYTVGEIREKKRTIRPSFPIWRDGVKTYTAPVEEVIERTVDLEIEGSAPIYGDHEFLAHIELTAAGNIIDTSPAASAEINHSYRTSNGYCDHCHTNRARKDVYIVLDRETGEQKQIGRTCLRDYMGIDSPAGIAASFRFFADLRKMGEDDGWSQMPWEASLVEIAAWSATIVRLYGWCSKGEAYENDRLTSTAAHVEFAMGIRPQSFNGNDDAGKEWDMIQDAASAEDLDLALHIKHWARDLGESNSDYLWNLKVIFAEDVIYNPKRIGIVASAITAYQRAMEKQLKYAEQNKAAMKSRFVGEIKERLRDISVTLTVQKVIGEDDWGERLLIKFVDDQGNSYSWFTGKATGFKIGARCSLTGTVKAHNEYCGAQETMLTRCLVKAEEKANA